MFERLIKATERSRGTLRQRLLIVLALAMMPFLFAGAIQSRLDARIHEHQRLDRLIHASEGAIGAVERYRISAEQYLRIFADDIARGDCHAVYARIGDHLPGLITVANFDADGMATCTSRGEPGFSIAQTSLFDRARSGQELVHSDGVHSERSNALIFALLLRRQDNEGHFSGGVAFSLHIDAYLEALRQVEVPAGTRIYLADGDGRVFGAEQISQIPRAWVEEARLQVTSQLFRRELEDGPDMDMVVGRTGSDGVYALIVQPSPGLFSHAWFNPMRAFGLPFLALCVTLMTAWLAIDQLILVWLKRVRQLAVVYREGLYSFRDTDVFDRAPEEVRSLAATLNDMAGRVSERDESLKHAIEVRDDAVKEIHHRVKNNLQIVTSFLNLQSRAVSDDEARYALAAARHRIDALAIVHSTLYQHERVEQVSIKPFLEGLLAHLSEAVGLQDGDIALETSIVQAELEADAAIPIALFVVEAVTHAMLNARDTSNGRIGVLLEQDGSYLKLIVSEEGLGAPDLLDMGKPTGLGGRLMMSFARQLHGRLITERTSELGFGMGIVFPYAHEQRKVA